MTTIEADVILLRRLRPGRLAEVIEIQGSYEDVARLSEMGLRQGSEISVSRGGITSIVHLSNGSRLCIRPSRDLNVIVRPVA